ncbi:hypothetical protein UlMin_017845 [Ulmus minor]
MVWASSCWSQEKLEVFAISIWEVWNLRNKWTHRGDYRLFGNEFVSVVTMLEEFRRCRKAVSLGAPSACLASQSWTAPPEGNLRLDIDASFSEDQGVYGAGCVARDSLGRLVIAGCWPDIGASSVEQVELLAVRYGLVFVAEAGLKNLQVFSDSLGAIAKINSPSSMSNEDGFAVEDIHKLQQDLLIQSFLHVPRMVNCVAHAIARFALLVSAPLCWNNLNSLSWLRDLVNADFSAS